MGSPPTVSSLPVAQLAFSETPQKTPQKHYKVAEADLPKIEFRGRLCSSIEELEALVGPWERLIETAVRKNPFFDPDFLIPAFKHLNDDNSAQLLVIEAPQRVNEQLPRVLCGLIPIKKKRFYGMPIRSYESWKHDQCFDTTPLIRADVATETMSFMFDFIATELKSSLFSFENVAGEGEFARLLTHEFYQNERTVFHRDAYNRACFIPEADAETYIKSEVAKNTRKGTLRLERKLSGLGEMKTWVMQNDSDASKWAEEFLRLEGAGWKGKAGTAMSSTPSETQFFREMIRRTHRAGKLSMVKIEFIGQPISMICDVHQASSAIHFKTAFDETYSQYTPGLIAELKNIERLHGTNTEMMDSCAAPNHPMINRVWSGRTRFQSVVVATGKKTSRYATAIMPIMQLLKNIRQEKKLAKLAKSKSKA